MKLRSQKKHSKPAGRKTLADKVPHWVAADHDLFFRGRLIKHFKSDAPNQEALLTALQAAHWAPSIEFHFPHQNGGNGKRRLRDAIRDLKRSLRPHLHFFQEGGGRRIGWCIWRKKRRRRRSPIAPPMLPNHDA